MGTSWVTFKRGGEREDQMLRILAFFGTVFFFVFSLFLLSVFSFFVALLLPFVFFYYSFDSKIIKVT